jgi:hypothetical protein
MGRSWQGAVTLAGAGLGLAIWLAAALPPTAPAAAGPADPGPDPCADGITDLPGTIQVCTTITGSVGATVTLYTTRLTIAASTYGIPGIGGETIITHTVGGQAFYHGMAPHLDWTVSILEDVLPPGVRLDGAPTRQRVRVGAAVTFQFVCDAPPCDLPVPSATPFVRPTREGTITPEPSETPLDPPTETPEPSPTPDPAASPTPLDTPVDPGTATASPTPIDTPGEPPTASPTALVTPEATASGSPTPIDTPTEPPASASPSPGPTGSTPAPSATLDPAAATATAAAAGPSPTPGPEPSATSGPPARPWRVYLPIGERRRR